MRFLVFMVDEEDMKTEEPTTRVVNGLDRFISGRLILNPIRSTGFKYLCLSNFY